MARCGTRVRSFEPEPTHAEKFLDNMKLNVITDAVELQVAATAAAPGQKEFVRVLGNTTGVIKRGPSKILTGSWKLFCGSDRDV